ncbi:acyl-CoA dehydrogenase family protein [Pseudomonas versuta]|uniref:Acyl-CoA dehydrogenase n=1 Tax=Pseudomonas versuta TaxID=1788301 RepID=A0A0M4QNZ3_9PSED|nr:acyl-CoA dehydrogenase family protein [Pseudomonas versuta]ALE88136.1 acyl-CoA dehydrogenase [Pseudomonas versuta]OKA17463.1 acyl-CoA dehydrogenase [Pseudomonas versuta]OKA18555.1 acyl-CoA dehydrogenase [Pseudomonas versuta]
MNLVYSEDHRLLADSAREFLAARSPVSRQRELRDKGSATGFDLQLWQDAVALGWSAIPFPENLGGLDFGCMGLGPIFESIGSNLSASPLLSSVVLSGSLLHLQGNPQQQDYWLSAAISGERRLALALDERARHNPAQVALQAVPNADGYSLSGDKFCVIDGVGADAYLVVARVPEAGISLFLVPADAPGLSVKALPLIDSRNHAQLQLRQVQVGHDALLGEAGSATGALNIALDRARVCLAAEMLGMAEKLFAMTLDYLKTRVQFDVAIGSFQSLQHRSAQLYVQLQLARSAVMAGLAALDDTGLSDVERQRLASLAKWKAGLMALNVANEAVQMHGGIGVTDELDVGLFLKRIRVAQASLGDADFHCERYADLMPAHA